MVCAAEIVELHTILRGGDKRINGHTIKDVSAYAVGQNIALQHPYPKLLLQEAMQRDAHLGIIVEVGLTAFPATNVQHRPSKAYQKKAPTGLTTIEAPQQLSAGDLPAIHSEERMGLCRELAHSKSMLFARV